MRAAHKSNPVMIKLFIYNLIATFFTTGLNCCINSVELQTTTRNEISLIKFEADNRIDFYKSSIEEIILTLKVDPDSSKYFHFMVTSARANLVENSTHGKDKLYIGGDGNRAAHTFTLDRNRKTLKVQANTGNAIPAFVETYYLIYTNDGWLQSPRILPVNQAKKLLNSNLEASYWDGVGG